MVIEITAEIFFFAVIRRKNFEGPSVHLGSLEVILAIFGHFCKIDKARIGAISWADIGRPTLSISKKLARWHPMQKRYSGFHLSGNLACYSIFQQVQYQP